ncbi:MAG: hypothetical protein LBS29_04940 [Endomicrobium sp.]|jgi:hypothetical protein|nr:hypothetical protein [Endomicrobium sp.]
MSDVISVIILSLVVYGVLFGPLIFLILRVQKVLAVNTSTITMLKVLLPFYNILYLRKMLYQRSPVFTISIIAFLVLALFRVVSLILLSFAILPDLVILSAVGMFVAIVVFYICYMINAFDISLMLSCGFLQFTLCFVCPPIALYYLGLRIVPYYKSVKDEINETFAG